MDFSRLQDRIKYVDVFELKHDLLSKKINVELKNSGTRMRALRSINRAYRNTINNLMHVRSILHYFFKLLSELVYQDSLYFEPALSALRDDIAEQQDFIDTTMRLGLPALENLDLLKNNYEVICNFIQVF